MRINFSRLLLVLLAAILIQRVLYFLLLPYFKDAIIVLLAIVDFAMAFFFAYVNYPSYARKYMLKDQNFHYNVLGYFVVFLLLDLFFYYA
ncbi:TPA: hypothetical protein GXZ54_04485 [bacterium]|jgi:hypothetical protein|nr:hypothetical protein [bacterium]